MKGNKITLIVLLALVTFASLSFASIFENRSMYSLPKSAGMSGAGVAIPNNSEGIFINPASYAFGSKMVFEFNYAIPFEMSDYIKNTNFIAGMSLNKLGYIAMAFDGYYTEGDNNKTLNAENKISFSYAKMLISDLQSSVAFGTNFNLYHLSMDDGEESAMTFGADLSVMVSVFEKFYGGVTVTNINQPSLGANTTNELPQSIIVGAAYYPFQEILLTLDVEHQRATDENVFKGGVKYSLNNMLALSGGIQTNPNSFSLGFTVSKFSGEVNYAFSYHPFLGASHTLGITYYVDKSFF